MKTKHTFAFTFVLGLVWTGILFAYASGPDPGVNGVFGPGTACNVCHTGGFNTGGSITISGLPAAWNPGQVYPLSVTISRSAPRYGFQFSAVNNASLANAGSLSPGGNAKVSIISGFGIQFAEHNSISVNTNGIFTFNWTAPPAGFGTIRFNVAGNAANNDGTSSGDFIFIAAQNVPEASDTTAPVISAVTSSGVTTSAATITWTTNEAADSEVDFGTTTAYGQVATGASLVTSHTINLTNLSAATTYHFRIRSADAAANLATSGDFTFATATPADTTAPVISAVTSSSITSGAATVTWTTDEGSDSQVEFGPTASYGQSTPLDITLATSHSVNLTGLASNTTYHFRVKSKDAAQNLAAGGDNTFLTAFTVSDLGGVSRTTDGSGPLTIGYGRILASSGTTPSGVAIFGLRQSGVLVTEAGVPDQALITSGRIFAEVTSDGLVKTGIAMANPNVQNAVVTFEIRNAAGTIFRSGSLTLTGIGTPCDPNTTICNLLSRFLEEDPYLSGSGFQGTFSFTSTVPISVIALRGFYNERSPREFLITTLPVLDLAAGTRSGTQVIPHFAAGGGWTTQIILVNPTATPQAGTIQFLDQLGAPKTVDVDGASGSSTSYAVAANSSKKFLVTGASLAVGTVWITPQAGGPVPTPLVIFSSKPQGTTVSEAGVPVTMGTAFRMFAQLSQNPLLQKTEILTGVAIANATTVAGTVTLTMTDLNGVQIAQTNPPLTLPASGQIVGFIDQLIPALAGQTVQGVLRISTNLSGISVVGLRERFNTRQPPEDGLITTTPPTLENGAPTTAERLFPLLVDGGDYTTQIILFSGTSGQTSGGTLSFIKPDGTILSLNIN